MSDDSFINACMKSFHQQAFFNTYWKTFSVVKADTDELKEKAFALRYQVYCVENQIIPPEPLSNGLERDKFDDRATQLLLIHKETQDVVGTLRVIPPDERHAAASFALQDLCDHPVLQIENRIKGMCEISRFCVTQRFRRRPRDGRFLPAYYEQEWSDAGERSLMLGLFRRRIPYAPLGLLGAAFEEALDRNVTNCVMTLESKQFHAMRRIGLEYRVLGPRIVDYGMQQPVIFNIKAALDNIGDVNPECWDVISDKGRLSRRANQIYQYDWQDSVFDETCREMILNKLL